MVYIHRVQRPQTDEFAPFSVLFGKTENGAKQQLGALIARL
ncbi:MAG: hypothetical protein PUG80_06875 [Eubacteriales bacterium]|nr:hypothetical protein [Eubacteriales bacterium]